MKIYSDIVINVKEGKWQNVKISLKNTFKPNHKLEAQPLSTDSQRCCNLPCLRCTLSAQSDVAATEMIAGHTKSKSLIPKL